MVNPNAAPMEIGNALPSDADLNHEATSVVQDSQRSGLWLLPAFVNHSCLPNAPFLHAVFGAIFDGQSKGMRLS